MLPPESRAPSVERKSADYIGYGRGLAFTATLDSGRKRQCGSAALDGFGRVPIITVRVDGRVVPCLGEAQMAACAP
jgi:hypothetical protein